MFIPECTERGRGGRALEGVAGEGDKVRGAGDYSSLSLGEIGGGSGGCGGRGVMGHKRRSWGVTLINSWLNPLSSLHERGLWSWGRWQLQLRFRFFGASFITSCSCHFLFVLFSLLLL